MNSLNSNFHSIFDVCMTFIYIFSSIQKWNVIIIISSSSTELLILKAQRTRNVFEIRQTAVSRLLQTVLWYWWNYVRSICLLEWRTAAATAVEGIVICSSQEFLQSAFLFYFFFLTKDVNRNQKGNAMNNGVRLANRNVFRWCLCMKLELPSTFIQNLKRECKFGQ